MKSRLGTWVIAATVAVTGAVAAAQNDSSFEYQGFLQHSGLEVNAEADFVFRLYDAALGGDQVGATLSHDAIEVSGGLFTVSLDFGAEALQGERWLEIDVRSPAGVGDFSTLDPRQKISGSPFSIRTRGIYVNEAGDRVGIGTTDPQSMLHMANRKDETNRLIVDSGMTTTQSSLVGFADRGATFWTIGTNPNANFRLRSEFAGDVATFDIFNGNTTFAGNVFGQSFTGSLHASNLTGTISESRLPQNAIDSSELQDGGVSNVDIADLGANKVFPVPVGNGAAFSRPIHIQKYGPFGNGGVLNTGVPTTNWVACVVGIKTFNGDIQEDGAGDIIKCYTFQQDERWHVGFDFRSHIVHEGWEIWVMYISRSLATTEGF